MVHPSPSINTCQIHESKILSLLIAIMYRPSFVSAKGGTHSDEVPEQAVRFFDALGPVSQLADGAGHRDQATGRDAVKEPEQVMTLQASLSQRTWSVALHNGMIFLQNPQV